MPFHLFRFLADWIIYPNSLFWRIWEKFMIVAIFWTSIVYMVEAGYSTYYSKHAYGNSKFGNIQFGASYVYESVFVLDIFVSMKKSTFVHIHPGTYISLNFGYVHVYFIQ